MSVKCIVFDFDGVLKESVDIKTRAFSDIYSKYGTSVVDKVVEHHLNNGGISRYEKIKLYHKNFLNITSSDLEIQQIADFFSKIVLNKVVEAPFVKGAEKFIKKNYKKYSMFISTGTPHNEIIQIVKQNKINCFFIDVFGSPESKINHLNKISNQWKIKKNNMIFIGDSITDKTAANTFNIKFIARTNKNDDSLANEKYRINDLSELEKIIFLIEGENGTN